MFCFPRYFFLRVNSAEAGIDRLLLVIDDYEFLQWALGEFLVAQLLNMLRRAKFESVFVILGRDQLTATNPAWDHHYKANLAKAIVLNPLSRCEFDELMESEGVSTVEEKERAWRDTQGYPYYVQLWVEEKAAGGKTAVMLKSFYARTTRWMSEQQKYWLPFTLFLDEVNVRTLEAMIGDEQEAVEAFHWFECEGSVRDTSAPVFRVREYLRSRLVDYLRISNPSLCEDLERRAKQVNCRDSMS